MNTCAYLIRVSLAWWSHRKCVLSPQLRVLVAPTRVCQMVTPALEQRCEALGQAGKDNDTACQGALSALRCSCATVLRLFCDERLQAWTRMAHQMAYRDHVTSY